jgi:hypothetical protein
MTFKEGPDCHSINPRKRNSGNQAANENQTESEQNPLAKFCNLEGVDKRGKHGNEAFR